MHFRRPRGGERLVRRSQDQYRYIRQVKDCYLSYSPSVEDPFAFYGGNAQLGLGFGLRFAPIFLLYDGMRFGAAYEAGPYRDFRSIAQNTSASSPTWTIDDVSASGWSGYGAYEHADTISLVNGPDLRFGAMAGVTSPDLKLLFENNKKGVWIALFQLNATMQFKGIYAGLTLGFDYLTYGLSASLGYVIKDSPRPGASSARPPTVIRPRVRESEVDREPRGE